MSQKCTFYYIVYRSDEMEIQSLISVRNVKFSIYYQVSSRTPVLMMTLANWFLTSQHSSDFVFLLGGFYQPVEIHIISIH